MKTLIGSLSSKLTNVSSHIEKEFLSAYRVHMLSVQEELRDLKSQVTDAEVALNDDEEVSRLEREVTWFSDETTRLRNQSNSMRKDMQHVVARIDALREQRQYLNEQLKTTLKRSRILEAELGLLHDRSQGSDAFESRGGDEDFEQGQAGCMQQEDALGRMDSRTLSKASGGSKMLKSRSSSALPSIKPPFKPKRPAVEDALVAKKGGKGGVVPNAMNPIDELRVLEEGRQSVELDIEAALRSVFSEIIDRKVRAVERTSRNKSDKDSAWRIDAASGGLTGLGLAHFSDTDRLSAIATFLGTPSCFKQITETLSFELEL